MWLHGLWDCRLLTVSYVLAQLPRVGPDAPASSKFLGHPRLLPTLETEPGLPQLFPRLASSHDAGVSSEEASSEQPFSALPVRDPQPHQRLLHHWPVSNSLSEIALPDFCFPSLRLPSVPTRGLHESTAKILLPQCVGHGTC